MLSNDEFWGLGVGLCVGAGVGSVATALAVVTWAAGVVVFAYALKQRRGHSDSDTDEAVTDGGTTRRDPQPGAAPEQPAVLDVEVEGDCVLGSAERGDVSLVVEAPAGISEEELEATLDDLPERMTRTAALFDGGDA